MNNFIKQQVKGYEIIERIGVGGFGAVYRAKQKGVEREVAIKAILPDVAQEPDFIRRFEAEAQLIARLEHMNIVPLYDYWRDTEGTYLVMRCLRGGSLADRLKRGALDLQASGKLLAQIASALMTAHQHDIIHRDIKPANILLDEEGNAYLTDFGIAKDINKIDGSTTAADVIIGSLDYISPEQARSESVTPRTDIYSLGVVLYEMLTGQHPFPNITPVERLYKHINEPLPQIADLPLKLVDHINQVIQKATAKKPSDRYENVSVFADAFLEAAHLRQQPMPESLVEILTPREQEILQLMINGLSNREIADQLVISISTVKNTQSHLYRKLRVKNRVQAIARGRELELLFGDGDLTPTIVDPSTSIMATMPEPENPYKGLRAFHSADSQDFFGREAITQKLIGRLKEKDQWRRFLAVVGPSGSGKSSLVRAGLIPAIWRGDLPGSDRWFTVEMLPGTHPVDKLEVALQRVSSHPGTLQEHLERDGRGLLRAADLILPDDDSQLLLVIDQFEELFTLVEDEAVREHFMDLIFTVVNDPRSRVWLIVTLRADFYDRPLRYRDLGELMQKRTETILPLSADELERAIVSPASRVGVNFEDGLVPSIIDEVSYQPGALPLLQFALTELFGRREKRTLTHQAFRDMGGTVGALANRADELFTEFDHLGQETTRQMFLRLVTLGEGVEDTRRRTPRQELRAIADDPDLMEEIVDTFAAYRLLSLDHDPISRQPMVEVAHEAILREWARLRDWINEARDEIRMQQQLARMSDEWYEAEHDSSFLARGSRLDQLEGWATETQLAMTAPERAFLDASMGEREREETAEHSRQEHEARLEHRAYRRLQAVIGVLLVASVIGTVLTIAIFQQSQTAQNERDRAEAARDESQSVALAANARELFDRGEQRDVALALAIEANKIPDPLPIVRQTLTDIAFAPGLRYVREDAGFVFDFEITPDGRYVLTGQSHIFAPYIEPTTTDLILWELESGAEVRRFVGHTDAINGIAISPDGRSAISSGIDGRLIRWNLETGDIIQQFETDTGTVPGSVAINPDGTRLIAATCSDLDLDNGCIGSSQVIMWDIDSGERLREFDYEVFQVVSDLTFSPDGRFFYIGGINMGDPVPGNFMKWDVGTGEQVYQVTLSPTFISGISVSPDGRSVVLGSEEGSIHHLDAETGEAILPAFDVASLTYNIPVHLTFSPDGRRVASAQGDGTVRIWNMATGQEINRFFGHTQTATDVAFTPDGRQLISTSVDQTMRLWDVVHSSEIRHFEPPHDTAFTDLVVGQDGRTILTGTGSLRSFDQGEVIEEYALIELDIESGEEIRRFEGEGNTVYDIALSPDGKMAAVTLYTYVYEFLGIHRGENDRAIRLWDLEASEVLRYFNTDKNFERAIFSPDGRMLLGGSDDSILYVWDVETGAEIHRLVGDGPRSSIAVSPDGNVIASGGWGPVNLWDAITGEPLAVHNEIHAGGAVSNVFFMPDGQTILSNSTDGTLQLWDRETGEVHLRVDGLGDTGAAAVTSDRQYAIYATPDFEIVLLDLVTGDQLARFAGHTDRIVGLAFSPDDRYIFSNALDGSTRMWEIPPQTSEELIAWAEGNRVIPDFTAEQRELYRLDTEHSEPLSLAIFSSEPTVVPDMAPTATPTTAPTTMPTVYVAALGENRGEVAAGETQVWTYEGRAGEVLNIAVNADSPGIAPVYFESDLPQQGIFNAFLRIRDTNGVELARNDNILEEATTDARIEALELPADGNYEIEVRGVAYLTGGGYTLVVEERGQDAGP